MVLYLRGIGIHFFPFSIRGCGMIVVCMLMSFYTNYHRLSFLNDFSFEVLLFVFLFPVHKNVLVSLLYVDMIVSGGF